MSLYEAEEPLVPLISAPTPPRSWEAMLVTWAELMGTLAAIVGETAPMLDANGLAAVLDRLHILTWTWMWSLSPCSMARNAAFMLGATVRMIDRWRPRRRWQSPDDALADLAIGQRAETLLRIAHWHIDDDARGEAHRWTLGVEPIIQPHERVYEQRLTGGDAGLLLINGERVLRAADAPTTGTHALLADHIAHHREYARADTFGVMAVFTETAIASLPDGPWVMTSQDVGRFLDMILEDAAIKDAEK